VALIDLPCSAQSPVPVAPQPSHLPSPRWAPQRLPHLRPVQRVTTSAVKRSLASTRKNNNGLVMGATRRSAISMGPSDISLPSVSRSPVDTAGAGSVPSSFPDVATSNGSLVGDKQSYEVSPSVTRTTPSLRSSNPPSRYLTAHSFIDACNRLLTHQRSLPLCTIFNSVILTMLAGFFEPSTPICSPFVPPSSYL